MTMQPPSNPPPKNEGLLNFLTTVLKKTAEIPEDVTKNVEILTASVKILAEELKTLTNSVELIVTTVQNQNTAITELYTVQEFILKQMKKSTDGLDTALPDPNKTKIDKPN